MRYDQFLAADKEKARDEFNCIYENLLDAQLIMDVGGYKSARIALENAIRSLRELEKLQQSKVFANQLRAMMSDMEKEAAVRELCRGRGYYM